MTNLTTPILLLTTCLTVGAQKLPTVAVLSTGGTIASKQDPAKGGYVPALSGEDLVSAGPRRSFGKFKSSYPLLSVFICGPIGFAK